VAGGAAAQHWQLGVLRNDSVLLLLLLLLPLLRVLWGLAWREGHQVCCCRQLW
jgi:hypothetical protein